LEKALKWQLVTRNVANSVEPPKADTFEAKFLNEEQTNILIAYSVSKVQPKRQTSAAITEK
jgi:hypothetical protein